VWIIENNKIGEVVKNNKGTKMEIIKYRNKSDIDVKFLDKFHYIRKHTTYVNFKRGQIKNPYDKSVFDLGFVGDGKYMTFANKRPTKQYISWFSMMRRCYSNLNYYSLYGGICTVCDEWLDYQVFAKWYDENYIETEERLHLDKDILYPGNKIYSPNNCLLVPQRINELFTYKSKTDGLPIGIKRTDSGKFSSTYGGKYLGSFNTLDKAFEIYKLHKEVNIKDVAEKYKDVISEKLYSALMNYEVLIENDANYNRESEVR